VYTTDGGDEYVLRADESNIEAVNGENVAGYTGETLLDFLPRNIKPRTAVFANTTRTRTISAVVLTQDTWNTIAGSEDLLFIDDPLALNTTVQLDLVRLKGETIAYPSVGDSGLNDGDIP